MHMPFAVHQAGQTITAEVTILDDHVYPFSMEFYFNDEHDPGERARVAKLVGENATDKYGKVQKPGIDIPLRVEIRSNDGKVLVNQTTMVGRSSGFTAKACIREVGKIRLVPGNYQIMVQSRSDHPELEHTAVTFSMHAITRGNIFAMPANNPSVKMAQLVDEIRKTDLLNHLSGLARLPDNTNIGGEGFGFPMPVAIWNACAYWVNADWNSGGFWITKICGDSNRQVYQGEINKN